MEAVKKAIWDWMSMTTKASEDGRSTEQKKDEGKKAKTILTKADHSSFRDDNDNNDGHKDNRIVMNLPEGIPREITVVHPCHNPGLRLDGSVESRREYRIPLQNRLKRKSTGTKKARARLSEVRSRMKADIDHNRERLGKRTAKRLRR